MALEDMDEAVGEREERSAEGEVKFIQFKRWFRADKNHSSKWREEAKKDYDFVAGKQWEERDVSAMANENRVAITFNRILSIIKSVAGSEINNRQEIKYLPRGNEDTKVNEILTGGSKYLADECDAEDEESEAFEDCIICGMGWTESRVDYELDAQGKYIEERIDPLEIYWDSSARKKNLVDARRVWRIRTDVSIDEARALFPGVDDEDLDAKWVLGNENEEAGTPIEQRRFHQSGVSDELDDVGLKKVTLVQVQWCERKPYVLMLDPQSGQKSEVEPARFREIQKAAKAVGATIQYVKLQKRIYKRAFIGGKVLSEGDGPCKDHFSWQCITAERDRNAGTFFGLVRVMRDPQMWANKWLSQALHIMNTSAKGGIAAEKSAFDDQRQAEESWARNDKITWLKSGAMKEGKPPWAEKPYAQFPAGFDKLMEFSISSIRDVTGVNLELLGMRDANQPGILEAQRKQAAMTILATTFNNLRRFRKAVGRIRLYFMQTYLNDGRLVRVTTQEGKQAVPLALSPETGKYDVVVDDSPTSPNQKEANWLIISSLLPVARGLIESNPAILTEVLEYSPLPADMVEKLKKSAQEAQQQPDPEQQRAQAEFQLEQQKAQAQLQMKQQEGQINLDLKRQEMEMQMQMDLQKHRQEMQMEREKHQQKMELEREMAGVREVIALRNAEAKAERAEAN